MHMIFDPTDRERNTALIFYDSTEITLKVRFKILVDKWCAIFCAKDHMIVQRSVCRWHFGSTPYRDLSRLSPFQGSVDSVYETRGSRRSPLATLESPLRGCIEPGYACSGEHF